MNASENKSIEIIVPSAKLAAAVNKWLIPGLLRHAAQQDSKNEQDILTSQQS